MTVRWRWVWVLLGVMGLSTGCWDQRTVASRAVVLAVAVDPGPRPGVWAWTFDLPRVTALSSSTISSIVSANAYFSLTVLSGSYADALLKAQERVARDLYFGQMRILALSTQLPTAAWIHVVDTFNRTGLVRKTFYVVAAPNAAALFKAPLSADSEPSFLLQKLFTADSQPYVFKEQAWKIWDDIVTPGITAVVPVVEVTPQQTIVVNQLAVLSSPRVALWPRPVAAGWAYLTGHVTKATWTLSDQSVRGIGMTLIRGKARWTIRRRGRQVEVSGTLTYRGILEEYPQRLGWEPSRLHHIERIVADGIVKAGLRTLKMAEADHIDPFGWHRNLLWQEGQENVLRPLETVSWQGWHVRFAVRVSVLGQGDSR